MNIDEILNKKHGNAFMYLEENFWIEILNKTLEKTKGNVTHACEILGISPVTFRIRCRNHGVDVDLYRSKKRKERKDRIETHKYWRYIITKAFTNTRCVSEASRNIGWNRSTLYRRMQIVGFER